MSGKWVRFGEGRLSSDRTQTFGFLALKLDFCCVSVAVGQLSRKRTCPCVHLQWSKMRFSGAAIAATIQRQSSGNIIRAGGLRMNYCQ